MSAARRARVLVTRPAAQAEAWVEQLRARGIDAEALPLIEIAAVDDSSSLRAAWDTLAERSLVVFVSANAVQHFFAARPGSVAWPAGVVAGAPGPGTADVLRALGCPDAAIVSPAVRCGAVRLGSALALGCRAATGAARACSSCAATAAATGSPIA